MSTDMNDTSSVDMNDSSAMTDEEREKLQGTMSDSDQKAE
jgi:hypothetical protein